MKADILDIANHTNLTTEMVREHWYNSPGLDGASKTISYHGLDIIDGFYPAAQEALLEHMDGSDCQECYLGYNPKTDTFAMAFDTWFSSETEYGDDEFDGFGYQLIMFKYDPSNPHKCTNVVASTRLGNGWYGGGYTKWAASNPGFIDLRLD